MIPDVVRALILGIVQGLTEFLPISSSGHLEIINHLLGTTESVDSDLLMVILVHLGTAFSILYVYRKDIYEILVQLFNFDEHSPGRTGWKIALSMIPAVLAGLLLESQIEALFSGSIVPVGCFLIVTGVVLYFTPSSLNISGSLTFRKAGLIGIAQAIAILPGISRSGMTIATALFAGVRRKEAARFSFLMVLPLILGKVLLDLGSGELVLNATNVVPIAVALLSSFLVGIWACKWMVRLVERSQIHYFAYYCIGLGLLTILLAYLYG